MSEPVWRVSRTEPINIYEGSRFVAVAVTSPADAAAIVRRMNEDKPIPPGTGVDWASVENVLSGVDSGNSLRGVIELLSRRLGDALGELEAFMQQEHREKCGGDGNLEDWGFATCRDRVCTGYRKRLKELEGTDV